MHVPLGGWRRATLTNKPSVAGGGFKHYGSLWRRNDVQWDLFLERGHMDVFEAEESLKTHPYVKAHTLDRHKFKELDPDGWKGNAGKSPAKVKPFGPHESPHDLKYQTASGVWITMG